MASYPKKRNTQQRSELLLLLEKDRERHWSADELFSVLQKMLPDISLATVYRNLEFLREEEKIQSVSFPGSKTLYDARLDVHGHFFCEQCGHVANIQGTDELVAMGKKLKLLSSHTVKYLTLNIVGDCMLCKMKK